MCMWHVCVCVRAYVCACVCVYVHCMCVSACVCTVVPVMNGHPLDQAKMSVHCRWPLVTGTDGQAGDAKHNTPCNTT